MLKILTWIGLPALVGGCGLVTEIAESTPDGGGSGAAGSGGSNVGTGGTAGLGSTGGGSSLDSGLGGQPSACPKLELSGPIASLEAPAGGGIGSPQLLPSQAPSIPLALTYRSSTGLLTPDVDYTTFSSATWPLLAPAALGLSHGGAQYVAAPGSGASLSVLGSLGTDSGLALALGVPHGQEATTKLEIGASGDRPLFVQEGEIGAASTTYLVGYETSVHTLSLKGLSVSVDTGVNETLTAADVACATEPIFAGGLFSTQGGYVIAYSTSRPWGTCIWDAFVDGPPTRVQITPAGIAPALDPAGPTAEYDGVDPVHDLSVIPSPGGGGWVVWQRCCAKQALPVEAVRIDAAGKPLTDKVELTQTGVVQGTFGVAAFGTGLVLARFDSLDPSVPKIAFHVFGSDGAPISESMFEPPPSLWPGTQLTVATGPSGKEIYAAWSTPDLTNTRGPSEPQKIHVARFQCVL